MREKKQALTQNQIQTPYDNINSQTKIARNTLKALIKADKRATRIYFR